VAAAAIDRLTVRDALSARMLWICRVAGAAVIGLNVWCTVERVVLPARAGPSLILPRNFVEAGFTPAGSKPPQYLPASALAAIDPPSGEVHVVRWEPLRREVQVSTRQEAILKLKTYYFPGWIARVDGQAAKISGDANGAQIVGLVPGEHTVEVLFVSTPPRILGGVLTCTAFLIISGLLGADFVDRRRTSRRAAAREANRFEAIHAAQESEGDKQIPRSVER